MRRFFAIVLLLTVIVMNTGIICRSLCMAGHGAHASIHTVEHEIPDGEMCPTTHEVHSNMSRHTHHSMPETSIKCACSQEQEISIDQEITFSKPAEDLKPYLHIISKIHSQGIIVSSIEPIPLEGPPKLIS